MFNLGGALILPSLGLLNEGQYPPGFGTYYGTIRKGIHAGVWDGLDGRYVCNVYTHDKAGYRNCYEYYRLIPTQEPTTFDNPLSLLAHIHHVVQQYDEQQTQLTHGGTTREDA